MPTDASANAKRYVPWVCIALFAANAIMFGLELAKGADLMWGPSPAKMLEVGGNLGPITLDGEQWRLLTSMFLHFGILHIAMNMLGLYQVGRFTEQLYGHAGFAALYLVAGLVGSLASAIRGQAVSAGASGAVFGVLGAFLAYILFHRKRLDPAAMRAQLQSLLMLIAINVWLGFQAKGIDQAAHLGGLISGFLLGFALQVRMTPRSNRLARAAIVGVLGIGAVVGTSLALGKPSPVRIAFEAGNEALGAEGAILDRWNAVVRDQATDQQIASALETDILPAWEKMQVAYIAAGGANPTVLGYLNQRRDGWRQVLAGLKAGDAAAIERGMQLVHDATIEK